MLLLVYCGLRHVERAFEIEERAAHVGRPAAIEELREDGLALIGAAMWRSMYEKVSFLRARSVE